MLQQILFTQLVSTAVCTVYSRMQEGFGYEKMHYFGKGNRLVPNYRRFTFNTNQYPQPLPSPTPSSVEAMPTPYHTLYQGFRRADDTRVYYKTFEYEAKPEGHHVVCRGSLHCKVTHLSVVTQHGVPIIFRGGVGYHHFIVIVKAKPGETLEGKIKAYCTKKDADRLL